MDFERTNSSQVAHGLVNARVNIELGGRGGRASAVKFTSSWAFVHGLPQLAIISPSTEGIAAFLHHRMTTARVSCAARALICCLLHTQLSEPEVAPSCLECHAHDAAYWPSGLLVRGGVFDF